MNYVGTNGQKFWREDCDTSIVFSTFLNLWLNNTVLILFIATTLMQKSTLSTNNFGNIHFGLKNQKQNPFRIFIVDYISVCLQIFQQIERKQEKAFWSNVLFFENIVT